MTREEATQRLLPNGPVVYATGPYNEAHLTRDTVFALQLIDALEKLGLLGGDQPGVTGEGEAEGDRKHGDLEHDR